MSGRRRVLAVATGVLTAMVAVGAVIFALVGREDGSTPAPVATPGWSTPAVSGSTRLPTTSVSTSTTTSSTLPPATTTAPQPRSETLARGSSGPLVADLEQRLAALHYWVGTVDDVYDDDTAHAVTAFEKITGLERDGVAGPLVLGALATAVPPTSRSTDGDLVEIDLSHQVLIIVRDGRTDLVFDTSTGKSSTPTATGRFDIEREIDGYHRSRLGVLYRPKYFHGGQAIHGFPSVPPYPASHGCVRLTNHAIDWLWNQGLAPIGTAVLVYR